MLPGCWSRSSGAGDRAVYLGGPKFEIMHKSRCVQKSKLVDWGAKHVDWGGWLPLASTLRNSELKPRSSSFLPESELSLNFYSGGAGAGETLL